MIYLYYFFVFVAGLFIGSFLNLVTDRLINGGPIFIGRSKCDFCGKWLGAKGLVPLLSFIFQKGKSFCCKKRLSFYYPVSEILTGLVLVASAYFTKVFTSQSTNTLVGFIYVSFVLCLFIIMFLSDSKYYLIPDKIVYIGIFVCFFFTLGVFIIDTVSIYRALKADPLGEYLIKAGFFSHQFMYMLKPFVAGILSSIGISLFFLILIAITKGKGMGVGDVKLGFLIGLFNGFPQNILAIFLGFLIGSIFSVVLIILKKKTLKDIIPFGPFLIMGSFISFAWGNIILNWYLNLFR